MEIWTVPILPADIEDARSYAERSSNHTLRKLEHQQSRYSNIQRNIFVGRVARNVVARALLDAGIPSQFEDTPPTKWKSYSIATCNGYFVQPRFIGDYPRHKMLPEDVGSFEKRPHHFYVATTSEQLRNPDSLDHATRPEMNILGYATRSEMEERRARSFGQGVLNRYVPLKRLHAFVELIKLLRSHGAARQLVRPVALRR